MMQLNYVQLNTEMYSYIMTQSSIVKMLSCLAGIKVLARIVQVDARYAVQHQVLVMQCLEHIDPTIQAKVCLTRALCEFTGSVCHSLLFQGLQIFLFLSQKLVVRCWLCNG